MAEQSSDPGKVLAGYFEFLGRLHDRIWDVLEDELRASVEANARGNSLTQSVADGQQILRASEDTVRSIGTAITRSTGDLINDVSRELAELKQGLDEKTDAIRATLKTVEGIASKLSLLAVNAAIEASHAGQAGAGFALVAQEVRMLAGQAMSGAQEASEIIDLTEVSEKMDQAVSGLRDTSDTTNANIVEEAERLEAAISAVSGNFDQIADNLAVLFEMIATTRDGREMVRKDVAWSNDRIEAARSAFAEYAPGQATGLLRNVLARDGVGSGRSQDLLDDIRARGHLRVAIEPSFVGLSFRPDRSGGLVGLDVDYALALSNDLGVRCEFIEAPWDRLTHLVHVGRAIGQPPADIVLSALPPSADYKGLAFSETYTYLNFVLARRVGATDISGLDNLEGKTLGIINDPGAFVVLEEAGVRWKANENKPGGKVRLKNLIAYSDQSRIHDCLAENLVDAFAVDRPIYHWACTNPASPWHGKIEICSGNIPDLPYYYAVGVAAAPRSYRLLKKVNAFITKFKATDIRRDLELKWQGEIVDGQHSYRDEPGELLGEAALATMWQAANPVQEIHAA